MRACRNMKPLFYVVKGDVWLLFYVHKAVRQRERKGEREREKKRWTLGFPASKKKPACRFLLRMAVLQVWPTGKQTNKQAETGIYHCIQCDVINRGKKKTTTTTVFFFFCLAPLLLFFVYI